MKRSFYCENCHSIYEADWPTAREDKAVCDKCGGELHALDIEGHSDDGGEG